MPSSLSGPLQPSLCSPQTSSLGSKVTSPEAFSADLNQTVLVFPLVSFPAVLLFLLIPVSAYSVQLLLVGKGNSERQKDASG